MASDDVVEIRAMSIVFAWSPPARCAPPLVNESSTRIVGASVADCESLSDREQLDARSRERAPPDGSEMLHAEGVHVGSRSNRRARVRRSRRRRGCRS